MYRNSGPRQQVLRQLKERGPATVDMLARDLGVVPVTMRAHLAALQAQGLVRAQDERGRVGRPRRRYSLTEAGEAEFPNRYAGLASDLLAGLQALAGHRGLDQVLDLAAARCAAAAPLAGGSDLEARVEHVADVLRAESGFAAWERAAGGYIIRDFSCPYADVTREHEGVCRYHTQAVTRLLARPAVLERSIARGDACCEFVVSASQTAAPATVRTLSDGRPAPERKAG